MKRNWHAEKKGDMLGREGIEWGKVPLWNNKD